MLSVANVKSAGGAASYYESKDNYYFLGEMATGWYGTGAESLGLEGPVKKDVFTAVLEGKLPGGADLTHMVDGVNKHRPGYDLTFSAPKSASVLALVAGDTFLVEAFNKSIDITLNEVEKLASTRTMKDGVTEFEQTGNLVVAKFLHDTSRNLDPNLHGHAVVANATLSKDGWKTLSTDTKTGRGFTDIVWHQQVSIGAFQRGVFRGLLEEAGYPIVDTGPRGQWDIEGVPVTEFSSRRQEILAAVGPDASAKAKSMAALDTRQAKDFSNIEEFRELWQEKLQTTGFNHADFEAQRLSRAVERAQEEHDLQAGPAEKPTLASAVANAIDVMTRKSVRFTYDNVLTTVLNQVAIHDGVLIEAKSALDTAIEKGQLIAVDKNQTLFTSAAHVRDEHRLAATAGRLAEREAGLTSGTAEQGVAARVADGNRGLTLVDARGGQEFQQQLLASFGRLAENSDRQAVFLTADKGTQTQLSSSLGKSASTVMTAAELAEKPLAANSLLVISEAERFSVPMMQAALQAADRAGTPAVVIDTHARRTTGFAAEVLKAAGTPVHLTTQNREQSRLTMVHKDTVDDRMSVAARYVAKQRAAGQAVVAQAGNSRTRTQLTREIRGALQEDGVLGKAVANIDVLIPVWTDNDTRGLRSTYQPGMVLERLQPGNVIEQLTIVGVGKENHRLTVSDAQGQRQGLAIGAIDSRYRLYQPKTLEVREGEQLKATGALHSRSKNGEALKVVGIKTGNWLFKEKLVLEKANGDQLKVGTDAPLKLDYGYVEALGASRHSRGAVVAVLSGKEVSDATVNQLRRSGDNIVAFTPLDEAAITARLDKERPGVSITRGLRSLTGQDDLTHALRDLQQSRLEPQTRAMHLAIEKVTGTGVTFSTFRAVENAMSFDRNLTPQGAMAELGRLERRGDIIALDGTQGAAGDYVSRANWQNELTILRHIAEGKHSVTPLMPGAREQLQTEMAGLTAGQKQAGGLILESSDRFIPIQGYAGVGKTTQFSVVASALQQLDSPPQVVGLAPTHRAVSELQSAGIDAQTIASFLGEQERYQARGETPDFSNTVFVIDENSMNGNAQMAALVDIVARGNGRAVLSGDKDQLKSLESGAPFALILERSAADVAVMQEIVRQTPALRPAIEAMIAGNVREAVTVAGQVGPETVARNGDAFIPASSIVDLSAMTEMEREQSVPRAGGETIHAMIADDYVGRTASAREQTLIVAELNVDRRAINREVHARLQEQHVLGDSVTVPQLVRVSNSTADLGSMTFWQENTGNTVRMGEQYLTVGEADTKSGVVALKGDNGTEQWLSPLTLRTQNVAVFETQSIELSVGERLILTATDRDRVLRTNDPATVSAVSPEGKITLSMGERDITLDPINQPADQHFDHGYAITTTGSQGASINNVIGLVGTEGARNMMAALDSAYVGFSRAKAHVQLYVDNLESWQGAVERNSGQRETVHDVLLRADDVRAEQADRDWSRSKPVEETRLAEKLDDGVGDAARFMGGKSPELLYAVLNEQGRQRGNWHVPVSPTTGTLNIDQAHYEGAEDGRRIVLQQGDSDAPVVQVSRLEDAVAAMEAHPGSAVVLEREAPISTTAVTTDSESAVTAAEITALSLESELETGFRDPADPLEPTEQPAREVDEENAPVEEKDTEEAMWAALDDALYDLQDGAEYDGWGSGEQPPPMMNEEVNILRHEEPAQDLSHNTQKTLE
ncbi:MobF family relaxase [Serratia bockelmannii]|uniref:MobF family relaxase n=1 Tax=Serratia bockelmannii TaxID=2703793 RepID=UPI00384A8B78